MARIACNTPSTGRPANAFMSGVPTGWTTIAEAPDFSVPDASGLFPVRDPGDATRAIRPGEVYFLTPLHVRNTSGSTRWIEVRRLFESGDTVVGPRVSIPAGDSVELRVQGSSLVKRAAAGANGDRLQVRAEAGSALDALVSVSVRLASEHFGVA
jgi:hypothetical protein